MWRSLNIRRWHHKTRGVGHGWLSQVQLHVLSLHRSTVSNISIMGHYGRPWHMFIVHLNFFQSCTIISSISEVQYNVLVRSLLSTYVVNTYSMIELNLPWLHCCTETSWNSVELVTAGLVQLVIELNLCSPRK